MNYKQNLHTHTTYADGKDTPEEMILQALELGFDSLGFSEHSYLCYSRAARQMFPEATERYKAEVRALKEKYRGRIDIFCGLELDAYSDPPEGFDYIIGSVHYLDLDGQVLTFDGALPIPKTTSTPILAATVWPLPKNIFRP